MNHDLFGWREDPTRREDPDWARPDTGRTKTYLVSGRVETSTPDNALKLDCTVGVDGSLGHITVSGASETSIAEAGTTTDCLYLATLAAADLPEDTTIASLRSEVAQYLVKDETCRIFYHNWTLAEETKEFFGATKTVGVGSHMICGGGATLGIGLYTDSDTGEYGLYLSGAGGVGFDIGYDASAQVYESLDHLRGKSFTLQAAWGPMDVSLSIPLNAPFRAQGGGASAAVGPSFRYGISATVGGTKLRPLSPLLRPIWRSLKNLDTWATREVKRAYGLTS